MSRIVTARQIGLRFTNLFGELGPELNLTGHHTAGPTDRSDQHCEQLLRSYHADHARKGWGGIGYHFCISRKGTIYCLRPTVLKGAHVGNWNTSNVGVVFHGTTGDTPTRAQARSYRFLLAWAHTSRFPAAHRTDRDLRAAKRRGHQDWPGHSWNACPGTHKHLIIRGKR